MRIQQRAITKRAKASADAFMKAREAKAREDQGILIATANKPGELDALIAKLVARDSLKSESGE